MIKKIKQFFIDLWNMIDQFEKYQHNRYENGYYVKTRKANHE